MTQQEAQAINDGRTQGEWVIQRDRGKNILATSGWLQIKSTHEFDCAAIVSAVNGTWRKGINPEAVEEMRVSLQQVLNELSVKGVPETFDQAILKTAIEALNAAKLA